MKLAIFVLVALLASFLPNAFGVLNCGSGGAPDLARTSMCNCYSGFAPSTAASLDCNVNPVCPPIEQSVESVGEYPPLRPKTSFMNDRLYITQQIPIVENRMGATVRLVHPYGIPGVTAGTPGASTCGYPGKLWNKTVNALDCVDEIRGQIPWSSQGMCGFVLDTTKSTNSTLIYKTSMLTQYNETFTGYGGVQRLRVLSSTYSIAVSFARQKTISNVLVNITMNSPQLKVSVVGTVMFDSLTGATVLTVRTTATWPYKIDESAVSYTSFVSSKPGVAPTGVSGSIAPSGASLPCSSAVNSKCVQEWTINLNRGPVENCDVEGEYTFGGAFDCRDGASCTGVTQASFALELLPVDFCNTQEVDASAHNVFSMAAYKDAAHQKAADSFSMGDEIYVVFSVIEPLATLQGITFSSINMLSKDSLGGTAKDVIYSSVDNSAVKDIKLTLKEVDRVVRAGETAELSFSFALVPTALTHALGSLQSGGSVDTTIEAVVNLAYYGNNKREVEMVLEIPTGAATKGIRVVYAKESSSSVKDDHSSAIMYTTPILSIFALLSVVLLF